MVERNFGLEKSKGRTGRIAGRWTVGAVLVLALSRLVGCAVGPDYVRSEAEIPPVYKETVD
jgi:hypothetical protein